MQLVVRSFCLLAWAGMAFSFNLYAADISTVDVSTSSRMDQYSDEWVTVTMPSVGVTVSGPAIGYSARGMVDILSAATPVITADAITGATSLTRNTHR